MDKIKKKKKIFLSFLHFRKITERGFVNQLITKILASSHRQQPQPLFVCEWGGGLTLFYWPNIRHRFCFRLHSTSTIRVCMNYNVNILSPSYIIYQTCLILKYHPSQIVSMNENYIINMFTNSIPHLIYPFKLTYYQMPCFIM